MLSLCTCLKFLSVHFFKVISIFLRDLKELMKCLTASTFQSCCKERERHSHTDTYERFANYHFKRSEVVGEGDIELYVY